MTGEQVKKVIADYEQVLSWYSARPIRNMDSVELRERINHLAWMCEQVKGFVVEDRMDKAFRWLGFLQGAFWAYGIRSIEEAKQDNTPLDAQFDKNRI